MFYIVNSESSMIDFEMQSPSALRSPRDCPSPTNSSASSRSVSIPSGEFDANECMDFLAAVLQQKGPLFLDELYGHLNKKYKPDVRQHFAKNPRELGEMVQQKGGTRFLVEGNLVSYHGAASPTNGGGTAASEPYKSPPGSAREGMKLRLAATLKQVVSDNKAKGTLPEPELDKSTADNSVQFISKQSYPLPLTLSQRNITS